ncbi:MAG: hypothetical protein HY320_00185 [Armatimonadetes bacterium]|nr:hypothetical protein [Armatimonadota bacterium]
MEPQPLKTLSIHHRPSKVRVEHLAGSPVPLRGYLERLPRQLAAESLRIVVEALVAAHRRGRPVLVTLGAHVIKCGLGPVLIDLARRRVCTAFATHGATLIHDSELALFGHTSEDVEVGLRDGTFGMAEETHQFINTAIHAGAKRGEGPATAVGRALLEANAPHAEISLLAQAVRLEVPITAHLAIGTDIVHMHPTADGAAMGAASLADFHRLVERVGELGDGGVLLNFGSAVILPEVVLKAFAVLRNRGVRLDGLLSVDFDMVRHYRSGKQIVERVGVLGGRGIALTGHHEIMLPLLAGLVLACLEDRE